MSTSSPLLTRQTLDWAEGIRRKYDIQGISIGIIASPDHEGDEWKSETHGLGKMDEQGRPIDGKVRNQAMIIRRRLSIEANSKQTLFATGSNSKLFAAIAIGILIEEGTILDNGKKLGYGSKIKDILPDWQLQDQYMSDHVDVLDLLCQSFIR